MKRLTFVTVNGSLYSKPPWSRNPHETLPSARLIKILLISIFSSVQVRTSNVVLLSSYVYRLTTTTTFFLSFFSSSFFLFKYIVPISAIPEKKKRARRRINNDKSSACLPSLDMYKRYANVYTYTYIIVVNEGRWERIVFPSF